MIKASMVCTNCKAEKDIPREELENALALDNEGELHLCFTCQQVWKAAVDRLHKRRAKDFADLQKSFGLTR